MESRLQPNGSKYFAHRPPPQTRRGAAEAKISTSSEYGHVAYQFMGMTYDTCSNMVAIILPADPPPTLGMGSKGPNSTYSEHGYVAYQIK